MKRLLALLMCSFALSAADGRGPKPDLPPAVRQVVDLARSAAPEFFADTIVTLVESGKIPQPELQVALLDDAFAAAARAQEPVRLTGIPGIAPDTRAIYRSKAGGLKLDALSLQSRILQTLLTVDAPRTRELFRSITLPALDPRPCEDPLVADASAYYEILGAVAQSAFSEPERARGEQVQALLTALAGTRSPNELAAFASAIEPVSLKPAQLELLLAALGGRFDAMGTDYRPFALSIDVLRSRTEQLAERAHAERIDSTPLWQGFRQYLVHQLTATRCDEEFGDSGQTVEWFNRKFQGVLPPVTEAEMKPSRRNGTAKADRYFDSDDGKRIGEGLVRLRNGERSSGEWRNQLADFLRDFSSWRPSGSDVDVFHQKATVLRSLLELTPPGEDRDRLIPLGIAVLELSDAQRQSPAEWLWEARALVEAASGDGARVTEAFRASGNAGLILFPILAAGR